MSAPISQTQTLVTVDGVPVAVVGDKCTCVVGGPNTVSGGSSIVFIEGKALARMGLGAHGRDNERPGVECGVSGSRS
ncbi:putative Zn-binding protein involved in type VI secretion [Rhizobium sp. BK619]|uniref:PAAR domain-containing protein n=1 Tax=Rhizobium sp. BK619 TaxID=2586989 RepID=UPI0017FDCC63|nr:putative Zn-binding protein involved in type VI secretion [Rhizobium sp. BK619]